MTTIGAVILAIKWSLYLMSFGSPKKVAIYIIPPEPPLFEEK